MKNSRALALMAGIISLISLEQLSKFWIVWVIPQNYVGFSWLGGFFRIIHVRNLGVAFSVGNNLPDLIRTVFFILVPVLFLTYLSYLLFRDAPFLYETRYPWLNRLALVFIIGGGFGNLIDRTFKDGVVDFIDVEFFGLFGLERWPAFNLADSWVFIGACCWILATFLSREGKKKEVKS